MVKARHTKQFLRSPKVFGHEHKAAPRNPPVHKNARFSPRENRKLYCPHCDREAKGWLHSASSRDTPALDLLRWPQCCRCTEAPLCLYKLPASTPRITRLCSPPCPSWLQIVQAPAVQACIRKKKWGRLRRLLRRLYRIDTHRRMRAGYVQTY